MQKETQYSESNQGLDREAPGACNVVKFDSIRFAVPIFIGEATRLLFAVTPSTPTAFHGCKIGKEFAIISFVG